MEYFFNFVYFRVIFFNGISGGGGGHGKFLKKSFPYGLLTRVWHRKRTSLTVKEIKNNAVKTPKGII